MVFGWRQMRWRHPCCNFAHCKPKAADWAWYLPHSTARAYPINLQPESCLPQTQCSWRTLPTQSAVTLNAQPGEFRQTFAASSFASNSGFRAARPSIPERLNPHLLLADINRPDGACHPVSSLLPLLSLMLRVSRIVRQPVLTSTNQQQVHLRSAWRSPPASPDVPEPRLLLAPGWTSLLPTGRCCSFAGSRRRLASSTEWD